MNLNQLDPMIWPYLSGFFILGFIYISAHFSFKNLEEEKKRKKQQQAKSKN